MDKNENEKYQHLKTSTNKKCPPVLSQDEILRNTKFANELSMAYTINHYLESTVNPIIPVTVIPDSSYLSDFFVGATCTIENGTEMIPRKLLKTVKPAYQRWKVNYVHSSDLYTTFSMLSKTLKHDFHS